MRSTAPAAGAVQLAVNAGSSSVKCALFTFEPTPRPIARRLIEAGGESCVPHVEAWVEATIDPQRVAAIGHRIVHGGPSQQDGVRIDDATRAGLEDLVPLAPNHLPQELAIVTAFERRRRGTPQVACFDTAFHRHMPEVARRLPIPSALDARGVRKYGFHGLSYAYLVETLRDLVGAEANRRVVLAHLGSGSSLAAVRLGIGIDTTMGFTPLGGVVMSTRSGDLDPGVVTYLARTEGLDAAQVEDLLSGRSGLLGISGTTGDMRELLAREPQDAAARLAVESYVYSIVKAVGAMTAVLGGLDTLVFSGGIGEHAAVVRARICGALAYAGVRLDEAANEAHAPVISTRASGVSVRVIPTDEERMIARTTYRVLATEV